VVDVQVADEDLVYEVIGDLLCRKTLVAATSEIEQELVPVSQLDQEARRGLLGSDAGHARAQGHDPHLVGGQFLGARVVDIAIVDHTGGRGLCNRRAVGRAPDHIGGGKGRYDQQSDHEPGSGSLHYLVLLLG